MAEGRTLPLGLPAERGEQQPQQPEHDDDELDDRTTEEMAFPEEQFVDRHKPTAILERPRPSRAPLAAALAGGFCATSLVVRPRSASKVAEVVGLAGSTLGDARRALAAGDTSGALELFLRAAREAPGSAAPYRGLGDVYRAVGNREAAMGAYRRYLTLAPSAPDAREVQRRLTAITRSRR